MDANLALAVLLVILVLPLGIFIWWARSAAGKSSLKKHLGDPYMYGKRPHLVPKAKARAAKSARPSTKRSSR